jgi:hypothetical protein
VVVEPRLDEGLVVALGPTLVPEAVVAVSPGPFDEHPYAPRASGSASMAVSPITTAATLRYPDARARFFTSYSLTVLG